VRLVGCLMNNVEDWIATGRFALTAGQIACVDKFRWSIETFFA